jgi:two-component system, chemotaxis family, response regulator Rcp1
VETASKTRAPRDLEVLVVDDQPENAQILREAMRLCGLSCVIITADDGRAALDILQQRPMGTSNYLPDLILLDLNLPTVSGYEVLKAIKADEKLKTTPVIVLSSSAAQNDIDSSYRLHANAYVIKPEGLDGVLSFVAALRSFWFATVALPRNSADDSQDPANSKEAARSPVTEGQPRAQSGPTRP